MLIKLLSLFSLYFLLIVQVILWILKLPLILKEIELQSEAEGLKIRIAEIKAIKERVDNSKAEIEAEIQKVAQLTKDQAEQKLLQQMETEAEKTLSSRFYKLENFATESLEQKAKEILAVSIQRLAVSVPAELFSTYVPIISEDDKGKIIGKEGRNIKAFEKATRVEVLVDDQPDARRKEHCGVGGPVWVLGEEA